jgi:RHS repeat-associated protein
VYTYAANSNQLSNVKIGSSTLKAYTYDADGRAASDSATRALSYNLFSMPTTYKKSGATLATYYYDANNDKQRDVSASNGTWDYIDGIVYLNGQLDFIENEEGRVTLLSDSVTYNYSYNIKDYLGNVRASYDNGGTGGTFRVIQENDYYPFGLSHLYYDASNGNHYLYNGKEQQLDLANQYDYGARFYDPVIGRWTVLDGMAEKYL